MWTALTTCLPTFVRSSLHQSHGDGDRFTQIAGRYQVARETAGKCKKWMREEHHQNTRTTKQIKTHTQWSKTNVYIDAMR